MIFLYANLFPIHHYSYTYFWIFIAYLVIYHILMTAVLHEKISINPAPGDFQKVVICLLLSPFAPVIILHLRKYYYHPKAIINFRQIKYEISCAESPDWDASYELEENMNLSRWNDIQMYRHEWLSINLAICLIACYGQYVFCLTTYNKQTRYMLCISIVFISITIIRIVIFCLMHYGWALYSIFVQSYWSIVLFMGYDVIYLSFSWAVIILYNHNMVNVFLGKSVMLLMCVNLIFGSLICLKWVLKDPPPSNDKLETCCIWFMLIILMVYIAPFIGCVCFNFLMLMWRCFDKRFYFHYTKFDDLDFIFWSKMRYFVENAVDGQDEIHRMCCINHELQNFYTRCTLHGVSGDCECYQDRVFISWLRESRKCLYGNVNQYSQLRDNNTSREQSIFAHPMSQLFCQRWSYLCDYTLTQHSTGVMTWIHIITDVLCSFYFITKVIQMLLPIICLVYYVYLMDNGSIIIGLMLLSCYSVVVMIRFYKEVRCHCIFYHVMPFKCVPGINAHNQVLDIMEIHEERILSDYHKLKEIPLRRKVIMDYLGPDIGSIVNGFMGKLHRDTNIGRKVWAQNRSYLWVQCRVVDECIGSYYGAHDHDVKLHVIAHSNHDGDQWLSYQSEHISFKHPRDMTDCFTA